MSVSNPTLITFVIYIAAMVLIGFMAYRSTNNLSDYILGGRSLGSVVTALSAGASDMSGWLLMGLPGAIYMSGLSESWIAIGLIVGAYLNWLFVAGRLRVQTEHNGDALTLPDYFSSRFEDKSGLLRIISAIVILVFFTIYCASGIVAGARLFESTFGMSYETALWAGAAATIAYTFIGGFLAVSWTDTVQATLMIFALLLTPIIVLLATGGVDTTFLAIEANDPSNFDMLKNTTFIGVISLMGWGLGYFGQPHILARFMAADSVKSIAKARRISMTWMILCLGGTVAVGSSLAPRRFGRDCGTSVPPLIPSRPFVKWACYRVVYNEVHLKQRNPSALRNGRSLGTISRRARKYFIFLSAFASIITADWLVDKIYEQNVF